MTIILENGSEAGMKQEVADDLDLRQHVIWGRNEQYIFDSMKDHNVAIYKVKQQKPQSNLTKRHGWFKIDARIVFEDMEVWMENFKDVLVIKCDNDYIERSLKYHVFCKHFDIIQDGFESPEYVMVIDSESRIIRWERKIC